MVLSYWVEQPTPAETAVAQNHSDKIHGFDVYAIFYFRRVKGHMFGYPNEEASAGHPLASRGYRPFAIWEVINSSWIAQMERMNRVHPGHAKEMFDGLRHFTFGFHDSTFEIVAREFEVEFMSDHWKRERVLSRMRELLAG